VALIRIDVSEDRITSIFRVYECEQVTERSLIRATRCHLPEDDNHHSHRRGNLNSYTRDFYFSLEQKCYFEDTFTGRGYCLTYKPGSGSDDWIY
jgi:hypothetical protein